MYQGGLKCKILRSPHYYKKKITKRNLNILAELKKKILQVNLRV